MSHGTGGIIISIVLDRLFVDLPATKDRLGKIEIYTFGNAAGWMGNPNKSIGNTPRNAHGYDINRRNGEIEKTISHIEHYANENDIFARWGILHNVREVLDNRYAGRVFVSNGTSSSLMSEGYLDQIWPICHEKTCDALGKSFSNACHIHSNHCETQGGCGNICIEHVNGNECGIKGCKSNSKMCDLTDCHVMGHKLICTKSCNRLDCEHEKECDTHGERCRGCKIHCEGCDGRHNLVCSRDCKSEGQECNHAKECQVHGRNCTGIHPKHYHRIFLDQVVNIDIDTAVKRESTAQKASIPQKIIPVNLNLNRNSMHHGSNQREALNYASPRKQSLNSFPGTETSTYPNISPKNTTAPTPTPTREIEIQIKAAKRASWSTAV